MPHEITWLVDMRVIYFHLRGVVSMEELREANDQVRAMTEQGIQFVHVIADATHIEKISFGLSDLTKLFRGMEPSPKLGWSMYISPKMLDRFFASVTTQMTTARHREFSTLAEAIAFVQSMDETLPTLPTPKPVEGKL
jgi:hypothetical protein